MVPPSTAFLTLFSSFPPGFSPHSIPPPPSPGSSPVRQWELGSTVRSPSAFVTDNPASATCASPLLSLSFSFVRPTIRLPPLRLHRRSPPRSPPLSTVGYLPLLPLCYTSISATTIVTTPTSPLPSPGVIAIFQPRRSPASPSSPPLPPFSATTLASLPRPPLSFATIAALRPSTPVTKTERHRRCYHRCLCSPFFLFSSPPTVPPCRSLSSPSAHRPRPGHPPSSPPRHQ